MKKISELQDGEVVLVQMPRGEWEQIQSLCYGQRMEYPEEIDFTRSVYSLRRVLEGSRTLQFFLAKLEKEVEVADGVKND
jgi:hypothetical protein